MIEASLSSKNGCFERIPGIIRLVKALQTTDKYSVATPANWHQGIKWSSRRAKNKAEIDKRLSEGYKCKDRSLCFKKI